MKPEQLAKDIERLQKLDNGHQIPQGVELIARDALRALNYPNAMRTINSLIDLVAMQHEALKGLHSDNAEYGAINNIAGFDNHWMKRARVALEQSSSIAALARKE